MRNDFQLADNCDSVGQRTANTHHGEAPLTAPVFYDNGSGAEKIMLETSLIALLG
jgi:hypothetical protein